MSAERWSELRELLGAFLECAPDGRAEFLDRVCAGRPGLREELLELAGAHERASMLDAWPSGRLDAALGTAPALTGTVLHYRILERLGEGGMGVVYQARDLRLERTVALKFLPAHLGLEPAAKERLRVEAQAAAALDHPNICIIHEIGEAADGQLFIAMPYYEGETLRDRLTRGPLPPDEAIGLTVQAARGLAKAHERGVIHRDIKPANLMITPEGVLKILDFGIAKVSGAELTSPGERPGTVEYMSPEQIETETLDGRTDVWSLGVVLYEMLTGERPFQGGHHFAVMREILERRPVPLGSTRPGLPEAVDRVLTRMLAKAPADRFSAGELVSELEQLRHQDAAPARDERDVGEPLAEVLPGGERRPVAVLVTTIADYEGLVEAVAPAELERLVERLRSTAEDVVRRSGGVLHRFTGDSLVAVFGVPTTHEDDPVRAVRAALELHRSVTRVDTASDEATIGAARQLGSRGQLRSAVHTGTAVVQLSSDPGSSYRVSGSVPQLAARLAAFAPPGEILVSPDCRRIIASWIETKPTAAVRLSSDTPSIVPFRVLGVSERRSRVEGIQRDRLTTFTGREREMAALRQALAAAISGEGQLVTVMGDAGLGKSRLLLELRGELTRSDVVLLHGHCDSSESSTPYLPFVEALRGWLGAGGHEPAAVDAGRVVNRLRELGSELEEFFPLYLHLLGLPDSEYPVPRYLHGEHYRLAMQEALAAFVTLAARRRPTVVLLEDWHWADGASDGVLQQVAELVAGFPLLVVVTSRTRPRSSPVRAWADPSSHQTLALAPLDVGASRAMLQSILRVDRVSAQLAELIHERAGGNPFFLEEITQTLLEEGSVEVGAGEAVLTGPVDQLQLPDTVQGVLRARLDRFDRTTREVLRFASVVGREFTRGILEHAMEPSRLPHALQALKAAGVIQQMRVVPEPAYRFKHVLTQEAAAGSLLEHQRKELHGKVGEAIEAVYGTALDEQYLRLADHFSRAEHWAKAVHYALRAAERSKALSQFSESLEILERAQSWLLRLRDDPERGDELLEILFSQERLCETLGLRGRQQRIIDELVRLLEPADQPARLAEAYQRQGDLSTLLRKFDDAEMALAGALQLRRRLSDALGERNLLRSLGLLRWHQGRDEEALRCIEAALAIDRERGDREGELGELSNLGNVLKGMGESEQARITLEQALGLSQELETGMTDAAGTDVSYKRAYILHNLANVHRELGDDARALDYLSQARTLTTEKRLPIQLSYHFTSTAHIYLQHGRVEESLGLYREAVELTRRAKFAPGLAQSLRFLGEVLLGLGRDEEALAPLVEAAGVFAQLRDPATEAVLWSEVAALRERRGELKDAFAAWGKGRALHDQVGHQPRELEALEGLARVGRKYLRDPSLALGYYGEALVLAERLGDLSRVGQLHNSMGIIEWEQGRFDEAREHYEEGLRIFRDLGDAAKAAHLLAGLGVTLDAMGRRVEARRCLEEACALEREAGNGAGEARALGALADVLRRLGEVERAIECGEASLALRRRLGDRAGEGWMQYRLALAHVQDHSADRARASAVAAAQLADETGDDELARACRELPHALQGGR
ncbi:MAG: tetratricopeptide repeat protein [Gemmatimonadota bacterium]